MYNNYLVKRVGHSPKYNLVFKWGGLLSEVVVKWVSTVHVSYISNGHYIHFFQPPRHNIRTHNYDTKTLYSVF